MNYIVPVILILTLVYGLFKRVNVYDSFVLGAKQSFNLSLSIFPYLAATFIMVNALRASGLDKYVTQLLSPPFNLMGVPSEVVQLMFLRPFSGSGSLALLTDVYKTYGVDSYIARCASCIYGSSETVFYVASVYFAGTKIKHTGAAIPIALFCNVVGSVVACLLCKVI